MTQWRTLVADRSRAISNVAVGFDVGAMDDPIGKEGLAFLTAQMLTRGAGDLDHEQFADELDVLGSYLHAGAGREYTTVVGDALTRNRPRFRQLMADVIQRPRLDASQLDKLKRLTLAELEQTLDNDAAVAQRVYARSLFGPTHSYGRPLKGTPDSIAAIGIDDVRTFHAERYNRAGLVVGAAGDFDDALLDDFIASVTGSLPNGSTPTRKKVVNPSNRSSRRVTLVDKPERTQTQVFMGHTTVDTNHRDYFPLLVGQTAFGGTFTSRLTQEIREKRGWSYGAYSYLSTDRHLGTFTMRFYPSNADTVSAIALADDMLSALVATGIDEEELSFAQNYLSNSHVFSIDTPERRMSEMLSCRLSGRSPDFVDRFTANVKGVTLAEVNAALSKHLQPTAQEIVVLGTRDAVGDALSSWEHCGELSVVDYRDSLTAER